MKLEFYKYHGTGNDFVILDNRNNLYNNLSSLQINFICDRHLGIGADGLMMLSNSQNSDFKMTYYNSDGKEGTMCGNGGRCIVAFAKKLNIIKDYTNFIAIDGIHEAFISDKNIIKLKMNDVDNINNYSDDFILDTGSPHFVRFVDSVNNTDVYNIGKQIRLDKNISKNGLNVNFVESINSNTIKVATYERGVEDETLSCGTGVTAAAISFAIKNNLEKPKVKINTKGGELTVFLTNYENKFIDIWLQGPSMFVYKGNIDL